MYKVTPETFRNRLYEAANIDHKSLRKWLTDTGIGVGNAQTILPQDLNGRNSIPSAEKLAAISAATGKSVDWLLGLDENTQGQTASARAAAGEHANELVYVFDWWTRGTPLAFGLPRRWLAEHTTGEAKTVAACTVRGDAMAPTLNDGDMVLLSQASEVAQINPAFEGIFVLSLGGGPVIRRLQMIGANRIQMLSDNPLYPPREFRLGPSANPAQQTAPTTMPVHFEKLSELDAMQALALFAPDETDEYLGFIAGRVEAVLSLAKHSRTSSGEL